VRLVYIIILLYTHQYQYLVGQDKIGNLPLKKDKQRKEVQKNYFLSYFYYQLTTKKGKKTELLFSGRNKKIKLWCYWQIMHWKMTCEACTSHQWATCSWRHLLFWQRLSRKKMKPVHHWIPCLSRWMKAIDWRKTCCWTRDVIILWTKFVVQVRRWWRVTLGLQVLADLLQDGKISV